MKNKTGFAYLAEKYKNPYLENMRLSAEEVVAIKECFFTTFPQGDALWLFGSRVDMSARGGDIDLYIQTQSRNVEAMANARRAFVLLLEEKIGEQKIDVVLHFLNDNFNLPIYKIAQEFGIRLV